jgi:TonB family protein
MARSGRARAASKLVGCCIAAIAVVTSSAALAAPVVVPPRRLDTTEATYPPDGKGDAKVVLTLEVDVEGNVTHASVREGASPFSEAAVSAALTWRFAPATRDGVPVAARILSAVTFHGAVEPVPPPAPSVVPPAPPAPVGSAPAEPAEAPLEEVAVKGEHEELATVHVPRSESRFVPGAFGDPFRVVEAFPGISPWVSGLPYFYVRGMSPENVGYFIDGVSIPLLFHVGAGPSTLAPSLVSDVDLFPAAYPARYGHFAGAVIAGETTAPNEQRAHAEVQARVFDASAFVETPLDNGNATALAAARYGYTGPLLSIIDPSYSLAYWDYQFRTSLRVARGDHLSAFVFGSFDELKNHGSPTFRVEYHRADLRYDHALPGGSLRIAATGAYDDTLTALQTPTGAGSSAALRGPSLRIRGELDEHVSEQAWVRAGADASLKRFEVDRYDTTQFAPHTDVVGGAYADVVWRPARPLEIVPGFRFDAYDARGTTSIASQPRISAKVHVAHGLAWISAFGIAHQEPTDEVFVPAKLPDPIDEVRRDAYQVSEALDFVLPEGLRARATGFVTLLRAPGTGEERSAGLELFVRREFSRRLGGFVSYTLSRTENRIGPDVTRASGDSTHILSVVLGYDLGAGWRIGGRFFYRSGRPYSVTCQAPDCGPSQSPNAIEASGELPDFHRIDVHIEKKWLLSGGKWITGTIEVFNALDQSEVTGVNSTAQGLTLNRQNPIILPSIGVEAGL